MISTRAKRQPPLLSPLSKGGILSTRRTSLHAPRDAGSSEVHHDPASLSATLRELAVRAHHAVRATDGSGSSPAAAMGPASDSDRELSELHAQIVQLQRSLVAQSLDGLAPYVSALRRKVEEHL
jgi:hypothetical protein